MSPSGLSLVSRALPTLILPGAGLYGLLYFLHETIKVDLPPVVTYALLLASVPISFFSKVVFKKLRNYRDAIRLQSIPVPIVLGKWPGNFDVMLAMKKAFLTGYTGMFFCIGYFVHIHPSKVHLIKVREFTPIWRSLEISLPLELHGRIHSLPVNLSI